jgi:hypothetical protein
MSVRALTSELGKEGRKKKYTRVFIAILTGVLAAASVSRWPNYAPLIQMLFYSGVVLGLLIIAFWTDHGRRRFWVGICLVVLLHIACLLLIRPLFPFKTILVVIPVALMEITAAAILFLKTVGY